MTAVLTVKGPVAAADLGVTLMHEHIVVLDQDIETNVARRWDEEQGTARSVALLDDAKAHGVDTIVDLTVLGLGRDIRRIARIASAAKPHVIVATGLYTFNELPRYFANRGPGTINGGGDLLTDTFVRDIEEGIGDSGIRAGILKCATDQPGLTPGVEVVLRSVARAHRRTGAPITTHSDPNSFTGKHQLKVFADEGVDLGRVIIGHCGDTLDLHYLRDVLGHGCYIGMDRFGIDLIISTEERVRIVAELCKEGFADRMVLSHDTNCYSQWLDPAVREKRFPRWRYTFLMDVVQPMLSEAGVTDAQIRQMLVDNPREIFSRTEPY